MAPGPELPKIRRLPELVINQIAAGEVVDRPASVVKELLENSLDAGASRIEVRLSDGGMECIQVVDNGHGMNRDDLLLSTERHATSKLGALDDLDCLATFGFRGEALASMASVGELEIRTRTAASPHAYNLRVDYGVVGEPSVASGAVGTTLTLKGLFARLPARRKFLKSSATELSHCARVVKEQALASPEVGFFLYHGDRVLASYPPTDRMGRFKEVFRADWDPIHLKEEADGVTLEAFLSPPGAALDRSELLIFINRRPIRNKVLATALRNGYAAFFADNQDPTGALYLEIRSDWVDVNVHPQKMEVRLFRQEGLFQWLMSSLKRRAGSASLPISTALPSAVADGQRLNYELSATAASRRHFRYLGQLPGPLLVCEHLGDLLLLDAHTLEAWRIYHSWKDTLQTKGPLNCVPLASPQLLSFKHWRAQTSWERYGIDVEPFGEGEILVKGLPCALPPSQIETLFKELSHTEPTPEAALVLMACQAAVPLTFPLDETKPISILEGLTRLDESWSCPHGRRMNFRLPSHTIQKHFEET